MKSEEVTLTDKNGAEVKGHIILCPECGSNTFLMYQVGKHDHLQCAKCGTSFCDNTCVGFHPLQSN